METDDTQLGAALRAYLRQALDADLLKRAMRTEGAPIYGHWWQAGDPGTAMDADLAAIRTAKATATHELATGTPDSLLEATAKGLMMQFGLPPHLHPRLRRGMMEATVRAWEIVERRSLGTDGDATVEDPIGPCPAPVAVPAKVQSAAPSGPPASSLVEPFFTRRETLDGATFQVMGQDRGTLRRFLEVCGDKPPADYTRADLTGFLDTLRRLPNSYGRSPRDKDRTIPEIIAEADARGAERLTDKTVKRHLGIDPVSWTP